MTTATVKRNGTCITLDDPHGYRNLGQILSWGCSLEMAEIATRMYWDQLEKIHVNVNALKRL
jgi:hypothetical protein